MAKVSRFFDTIIPLTVRTSADFNNQKMAKIVVQSLRILANKIEEHPEWFTREELTLLKVPAIRQKTKATPPVINFDIFDVLADEGEQGLRDKLEPLEIKTLKKIISNDYLDPSRLAQKWRKKDRLINFIVERTIARSKRGEVFLNS